MSRKIIGITVGTQLPKPNLDQTDPNKGDYIKGDRTFLTVDDTLTQSGRPADAKAVGDALKQSDWNQTDDTQKDFIKNKPIVISSINGEQPDENGNINITELPEGTTTNQVLTIDLEGNLGWEEKPFYNSSEISIIAEGTQYRGQPLSGPKQGYEHPAMSRYVSATALIPGDTYLVTYNGVEYTGVAQEGPQYSSYHDVYLFSNNKPSSDNPISIYTEQLSSDPGLLFLSTNLAQPSGSLKLEHLKGTVKTLDEQYIPNTIARIENIPEIILNGSTENQVLTTGRDGNLYWEDKPFYESLSVTGNPAQIPMTTITSSGQKLLNGYIMNSHYYYTYFDNTIFEGRPVSLGSGSEQIIYLGNLSLCNVGEDNGLPFCIKSHMPPTLGVYCYVSDASIPHSIEVSVGPLAIKTLDEKYIPDTIARVGDVPQDFAIIEMSSDKVPFLYYSEFKEAQESGKIIIVKYTDVTSGRTYVTNNVHVDEEGYAVLFLKNHDSTYEISYRNDSSIKHETLIEHSTRKLLEWDQSKTNSEEHYPSIKAMEEYVSEILNASIVQPEEATDEEIMDVLLEVGIVPVITDSEGAIYTDENNNILLA